MELIRWTMAGMKIRGMVVPSIDKDNTQAASLAYYHPSIFAKGGDRVETNMPQSELDACKRFGIKIVYGVGGKLNSSSAMDVVKSTQ